MRVHRLLIYRKLPAKVSNSAYIKNHLYAPGIECREIEAECFLSFILCSLLVVLICLTMAPLQGISELNWSLPDFGMKASAKTVPASGS